MQIVKTLDQIHARFINKRWAQVFTAFTRCILAIGFIPPSIPKILHQPFTVLPDSNPVGHYFNALYQTGFYYEFIGWAQLTAAILLLIPRVSHIGALMFLPIIANIAVLTTSVGFQGTWIITILMCTAATYLVAWEYDRLKPILFANRDSKPSRLPLQFAVLPAFFAVGGAVMALAWWAIRLGNFQNYLNIGVLLSVLGALFGLMVAVHLRFMPAGRLSHETGNS